MKTWQLSSIGKPVVFEADARNGTVELVSGDLQDLGATSNFNDAYEDADEQRVSKSGSSRTACVVFCSLRMRFSTFGVLRGMHRRSSNERRGNV